MEGKKKKEKEKNRTVNTREREAKTCVYGIWSSNEKHRVSGHVFIMLKSKDPEAIRRRLQIIIHIFSIFPFGSFSADVNIYHRRLAEPVMCRAHRLWRLFCRHVSSRDTLRLYMLLLFLFFFLVCFVFFSWSPIFTVTFIHLPLLISFLSPFLFSQKKYGQKNRNQFTSPFFST